MKNTWTTIEEQQSQSHRQLSDVLFQKKAFWKDHSVAVGASALGLCFLLASLFLPGQEAYKADITAMPYQSESLQQNSNPFQDEEEFQSEALAVDVAPLMVEDTPAVSLDPVVIKEENPFLALGTQKTQETSQEEMAAEETIPTVQEKKTEIPLNPFVSLVQQQEKVTGVASNVVQNIAPVAKVNTKEVFHSSAPTASIKENMHTYDTVNTAEAQDGELQDVLEFIEEFSQPLEEANEESFHATTKIVPVQSDANIFTGILESGRAGQGYSFGFFLRLENNERLQIHTQRDLRNVVGKEISIEIEGTKENFVLKHVYYKKKQTLPQTGPELLFILSTFFACIAAYLFRRKA